MANDNTLTAEVTAAIQVLWEEGCPAAQQPSETAAIAIRRWRSSRRRLRNPTASARMRDLVKGLIEAFEPQPRLVGPVRLDYQCVADRFVPLLTAAEKR